MPASLFEVNCRFVSFTTNADVVVIDGALPVSLPTLAWACIPCRCPVVGVLSIIVDLAAGAASLGTDLVVGALARLHQPLGERSLRLL